MRADDPRVQLVVDYLAAIGSVRLLDEARRPLAVAEAYWSGPRGDGDIEHETRVERIGPYTLVILVSPGMSPHVVADRIERCKLILRTLFVSSPKPPVPGVPPAEGGSGNGPANAELRVWPLRKRMVH